MSNDNLILFPKKSKPTISMSNAEAKWMVSGSLLVVLTLALGVNSALFAQQNQPKQAVVTDLQDSSVSGRSIASTNPIFRVSWEKRAFEVLEKAKARDLANVGKKPSIFDKFAFGTLEGHYSVRKVDGLIREIQFDHGEDSRPKSLFQRQDFLKKNLALFSDKAQAVEAKHVEDNEERTIERFNLLGQQGETLGVVQVLLDKNQNLLSMTVQ